MGHGLVSDNVIASRQLLYHALARVKDAVMKAPVTIKAKAAENAARRQGFRLCGHKAAVLKGDVPVFTDKTLSAYETGKLEYVMERQKDILSKIRRQSRPEDFAMDSDAVSRHFIPGKGWDGDESIPWTVEEAWKDFGIVDFLGHDVTDVGELAAMWSIYNNPDIEYGHLVAVKDGKVAYQMMCTSGLANSITGLHGGLLRELVDKIDKTGCDSVYFIHNHPAANLSEEPNGVAHEPSLGDLEASKILASAFGRRFKASLVLSDDVYTVIPGDLQSIHSQIVARHMSEKEIQTHFAAIPYSLQPHVAKRKSLSGVWESSKWEEEIIAWIGKNPEVHQLANTIKAGHKKMSLLVLHDASLRIRKLVPCRIQKARMDKLRAFLDSQNAALAMLVTEDLQGYCKFKEQMKHFAVQQGAEMVPVFDCVFVDGAKIIRSASHELGAEFGTQWDREIVSNRLKLIELMPKQTSTGISAKRKENRRNEERER